MSTQMGERIREARQRLGLSASQLAKQVGVSHVTVGNWESGKYEPKPRVLERLVQALGTDERALRYGVERVTAADRAVTRRNRGVAFSDGLQDLIDDEGATADDLAVRTGIAPARIMQIVSGQDVPTPREEFLLSKHLGLDTSISGWMELEGFGLGRLVPDEWPPGLWEFVSSDAARDLGIAPIEVPLLAAMSMSRKYWLPIDQQQWHELAEMMQRGFAGIRFRLTPVVDLETLIMIEERFAAPEEQSGREAEHAGDPCADS